MARPMVIGDFSPAKHALWTQSAFCDEIQSSKGTCMAGWLRTETLMMRGNLNVRRKRYQEALECYYEVTQLRPDYATAFAQLGYCLAAVGRHRDALDAYELALQIRTDLSDVFPYF